jgi:hypothetical protein
VQVETVVSVPSASRADHITGGEICPHPVTKRCDLHNQTMTITLMGEQA